MACDKGRVSALRSFRSRVSGRKGLGEAAEMIRRACEARSDSYDLIKCSGIREIQRAYESLTLKTENDPAEKDLRNRGIQRMKEGRREGNPRCKVIKLLRSTSWTGRDPSLFPFSVSFSSKKLVCRRANTANTRVSGIASGRNGDKTTRRDSIFPTETRN